MLTYHRRGFRTIILPPLLLLWIFIFQWCCGDGPTKYNVEGKNSAPETNITSKMMTKVDLETDTLGVVIN